MNEKAGNTVYESLNLETIGQIYNTLEVGNSTITYGCPNSFVEGYVRRVYHQLKPCTYSLGDSRLATSHIEGLTDHSDLASKLGLMYSANPGGQVIDIGLGSQAYLSPYGFLHACRVLADGTKVLYSIGSLPHIGISCLIRKVLLTDYVRQYPNLVVFHSNAVVDTRSHTTMMFSGEDVDGAGGKRGKTTMSLSLVVQDCSPFAYLANEDVILVQTSDETHWLPLPAEINTGEGTLRGIWDDGYQLVPEQEQYEFYGEKHYMLTPGELIKRGFQVASEYMPCRYWFVVDLKPGCDNYSIEEIPQSEIEREVLKTVKRSRMGHAYLPDVLGEQESQLGEAEFAIRAGQIEISARSIISRLIADGTRFLRLKGGVDRNKLYGLIRELTENE